MNHNEHVTILRQFRQEVYQNFNKRADTLMNLLDALSSNTTGQTVVELSLNPAGLEDSLFQEVISPSFNFSTLVPHLIPSFVR